MDGGQGAFALVLNVLSSVAIVYANKVLMDPVLGLGFTFAISLSALHFLACSGSIRIAQALDVVKPAELPSTDVLLFVAVANVSIASLNVSLLINTVGFYQISKLLVIPFVCGVEYIWLQRVITLPMLVSVVIVMLGVGTITVYDATVTSFGALIAGVSVVSSGAQQILCGYLQRKHSVASHQLLAATALLQGATLLAVGPFLDLMLTGRWIINYSFNLQSVLCLAASCAIAVLVNISQFMCLSGYSALTFQIMGHTKTITILLISWGVLHEMMSQRKLYGMATAVAGMVAYGYFSGRAATFKEPLPATKSEVLPFVKPVQQTLDKPGADPV